MPVISKRRAVLNSRLNELLVAALDGWVTVTVLVSLPGVAIMLAAVFLWVALAVLIVGPGVMRWTAVSGRVARTKWVRGKGVIVARERNKRHVLVIAALL